MKFIAVFVLLAIIATAFVAAVPVADPNPAPLDIGQLLGNAKHLKSKFKHLLPHQKQKFIELLKSKKLPKGLAEHLIKTLSE